MIGLDGKRPKALLGGSLLLGGLVLWLWIAPSTHAGGGSAAASNPAPEARALPDPSILQSVQSHLEIAKGQTEKEGRLSIRKALKAKHQWIEELYDVDSNQVLLGCQGFPAGSVLIDLMVIDVELERATETRGLTRSNKLQAARAGSHALKEDLKRCIHPDEGVTKMAATFRKTIGKLLNESGDEGANGLGDRELKSEAKKIGERKRDALTDEKVYGCDVVRIYLLLEKIDVLGEEAKDGIADESKRNKLLDEALEEVARLIEIEKQMPCGGAVPPPDGACEGSAAVFSGNERQFTIGCPAAGSVTNLTLTVPGAIAIVNHLPPAGGDCTINNAAGAASYTCNGDMGAGPSFRLDFSKDPSGLTADFAVNHGQFAGQILIP